MFNCTKCGLCCTKMDIVLEGLKGTPMEAVAAEFPHGFDEDGVCEKFDQETKMCTVYESRPELCRVDRMYEFFKGTMTIDEYHEMNHKGCLAIQNMKKSEVLFLLICSGLYLIERSLFCFDTPGVQMAVPPLLVAGLVAAGGAIGGGLSRRKARKQQEKMIKNMPKYEITDEAYDNQAMAKAQAKGRDRSIQMAQENLDQDAATAAGQARDITSSTSSLLSTIAAINASKNAGQRDLAMAESQIQNQKMGQLYAANQAMIDEKDKKFRQNKQAPWQARMQLNQDNSAQSQNMWNNIMGAGLAAMGSFGGGFGGLAGGRMAGGGAGAPTAAQSAYSSNSRLS